MGGVRPGQERGEDPRQIRSRQVNRFGGEYQDGEAYSVEMRQRIVQDYMQLCNEEGDQRPVHGYARIGRKWKVDPKTVFRWVKAWKEEHRLVPLEKGTINEVKLTVQHIEYLRVFLQEERTRYIWELRQYMGEDLDGVVEHPWVSETTIWRILSRHLDMTSKQVKRVAAQQVTQECMELRRAYFSRMFQVDPRRALFADEFGSNTSSGYRNSGWAPGHGGHEETRATVFEPKLYAPNVSTMAVISMERVEHFASRPGGIVADDWWAFLCDGAHVFGTGRFDVLVVDNARIHHATDEQVEYLLSRFNMRLEYLPPYSPDLNPIEEVFGEVKGLLKDERNDMRLPEGLDKAIERALNSITKEKLRAYYRVYL